MLWNHFLVQITCTLPNTGWFNLKNKSNLQKCQVFFTHFLVIKLPDIFSFLTFLCVNLILHFPISKISAKGADYNSSFYRVRLPQFISTLDAQIKVGHLRKIFRCPMFKWWHRLSRKNASFSPKRRYLSNMKSSVKSNHFFFQKKETPW